MFVYKLLNGTSGMYTYHPTETVGEAIKGIINEKKLEFDPNFTAMILCDRKLDNNTLVKSHSLEKYCCVFIVFSSDQSNKHKTEENKNTHKSSDGDNLYYDMDTSDIVDAILNKLK